MKLLHIDSSALGDNSASRALTAAIVGRFRSEASNVEVIYYDLDAEPLPHLTSATLAKTDATEAARSERALNDFLAADVVVIGAPMYNFSIPSTLKAWIDRIAIAGKTFRYTEKGPEGLARGKRAIVAISQGGMHELGGASEHQESYLKWVLNFLGIDEVEMVRAQGLAYSAEHRAQALTAAMNALPEPLREAA